MRVNEVEISGVLDEPPAAVKKALKDKKERKKKPSLKEVVNDVPPVSATYEAVHVDERSASLTVIGSKNMSPLQFFELYISAQHLELIAQQTNINAELKREKASDGTLESDSEREMPSYPRPWKKTTGAEIGVFLAILLMQGTCKLPRAKDYWNTHEDLPIIIPIQTAMSLVRWEQLKRYLKILNPTTDKDSKGTHWYTKVEPLYSDFVKASRDSLLPGRDVSIDEQLILFKGRSKHAMLIPTNRAGRGFKIYSLYYQNYMISFMFSSKAAKISSLKRVSGFTDSSSIVIQFCRLLPTYGEPNLFILYTDNFFTNVKLFKYLRQYGIGACGTAKAGSGFPAEILVFRDILTKKKDWGFLQATTVDDEVLCMVWQDLNTVQLMTTCHSLEEVNKYQLINGLKRNGIPLQSRISAPSSELSDTQNQNSQGSEHALPIPMLIRDYNKDMGGSDGNAQMHQYYSFVTRSFRYWWPLFRLLVNALILNAYTLWQLAQPDSQLSHQDFQHEIAMQLIQNPAGNTRQRPPKVSVTGLPSRVPPPDHHWIQLAKKQYCIVCHVDKIRPCKKGPLAEIGGNGVKRWRRGARGCSLCPDAPCCKTTACWEGPHA